MTYADAIGLFILIVLLLVLVLIHILWRPKRKLDELKCNYDYTIGDGWDGLHREGEE